jgi:hypothetical protein
LTKLSALSHQEAAFALAAKTLFSRGLEFTTNKRLKKKGTSAQGLEDKKCVRRQ